MGTRGGGITIFDGVEFKTFTTKDGLSNNYINCLTVDAKGVVWIGSNDGISYSDGKQFKKVPGSFGDNLIVRDFEITAKGSLYCATNKGAYEVTQTGLKRDPISKGLNLSVIHERKGEFWYATNEGLYRSKPKLTDCGKVSNYMHNAITSVTEDKTGKLWIGTYGDGMYCFDGKMYYRIDLQHELYRKTVLNVFVDASDNLWIATLRSGVIHYDKATKTFTTYGESEGLSNNHVRCILQDNTRQFWFGTSGGGVCQFLGKQFATYDTRSGLAGNFIYSVFRDSQDRLWIGNSQKGVSVIDKRSVVNYTGSNGFADLKIKSIAEDASGTIWLGTDGSGVYIYKNETFQAIESLRGAYIKQMISDKNGVIWMATAGSGLIKVTEKGANYIVEKWGYREGLLSNRITSLHLDKKGRIWYGSESDGVGCFDPKLEKNVSRYSMKDDSKAASNMIRSLAEDRFGRLWIGTAGGGLSVLSIYKTQWFPWHVRQADGLRSDNIYLLIADGEGNIISGTEKGIDHLFFRDNGGVKQIKSYGNQEGFSGVETCQNSSWLDKNGSVWLGTINGLCQFNPAEMATNSTPPKLVFKDVKLFYESLLDRFPNALTMGSKSEPLELAYHENHIAFEFLGINLKRPENVMYRWQLVGFDDRWSPLSKDRNIVYSNLNPGTYTFRLKACNEDGVWSEPISYSFIVATPYWKTIWFRVLMVLTAVVLLLLIYIVSLRRIRKNAQIRQREVEFGMELLELEQKAMRLQMNPHFIFNALNSIQSLIGTGKETEARYFLAKFSRLMRQILDNSRKSSITLQEEIQSLENYLLIEQFCNGHRFEYEISVDPTLEVDFLNLPPMILQPFVENAIKHGMRGIPEGSNSGRISIRFTDEQTTLKCVIEDNGIGREKAAELNKQSKETYHESTAMRVTTDRLNLMETEDTNAPLEIIDLHENGVASGTRVIIRLPLN